MAGSAPLCPNGIQTTTMRVTVVTTTKR